jgi:hypothetical protein
MAVRHLRLVMAVFFLVMAGLLFFREQLFPGAAGRFRDENLALGAWLAVVLAGWNMARWYLDWSARRERRTEERGPLSARTHGRDPEKYEPNPELDFLKVPDAEKPPPGPSSSTGDSRAHS